MNTTWHSFVKPQRIATPNKAIDPPVSVGRMLGPSLLWFLTIPKSDVFRTSDRQILPLQDQQLTAMLAKRFFERAQLSLQLPGPFPATNGRASRHHSVLFFPSNHFRRSATPMLYAFPSFAAGSSLACKAFRICLSFVPMRMAASLTVTAMRSSNGDLDDIMWPVDGWIESLL